MIDVTADSNQISSIDKSSMRVAFSIKPLLSESFPQLLCISIFDGEKNLLAKLECEHSQNHFVEFYKTINTNIKIFAARENQTFLVNSLLKSLYGFLSLNGNPDTLVFNNQQIQYSYELESFGFRLNWQGDWQFIFHPKEWNDLTDIKKSIYKQFDSLEKAGRGLKFDVSQFSDNSLQGLMKEYNDLAWGRTSWAKNFAIADDEIAIIRKYSDPQMSALEIGSGSGRITFELAKRFAIVTATDYLEPIVESLKMKLSHTGFQNIQVDLADVLTPTDSKKKYQRVFFLENGLGGLLRSEERSQALKNLSERLTDDGILILGLRSFGEQSFDHVMPAQQTDVFFGVYHVFGSNEVSNWKIPCLEVIELVKGEERPAGGHALFIALKKKETI